jgi:large-conductance mechanosensitive channel
MRARLRSWRQYIREHWIVVIIIALVIAMVVLIFAGSLINGTGFNSYYITSTTRTISGSPPTITRTEIYQPGKTLWDWLQLLIIPIVIAVGVFWLNQIQKDREQKAAEQRAQTEHEIALDNQRETALQEYIDKIAELLLEKHLRESKPGDEVRTVARVRTLTVLPHLDKVRKRSMLKFLHESGVINRGKSIVGLDGADLSGADLSGVSLRRAYLSDANLSNVDLSNAYLSEVELDGANLSHANLSRVDLSGAYLAGADLSGANLSGAKVTQQQLDEAGSLKGATMPDGSKHL